MMKPLQKSKSFYLVVLLFIAMYSNVYGQQIRSLKYKAAIQNIDSSGVYRVKLAPELIAKSNNNLSDIRLFDNKGKNIAYVLSNKLKLDKPDSFIIFPGIDTKDVKVDTSIGYIAENKNMLDISCLWIKLKNTAVNRIVNLSGSDDLKQWFAIKEDISLEAAGDVSRPDFQQSLMFPVSNYRYFKITVTGKNKVPVKILQAGIYTKSLDRPVFSKLPPVKFFQKDTNKMTRVFIDLKESYQLNKIHLDISGPKYYGRRILVYANDNTDNALADTILSSSGSQDISLSVKAKHIRMDIINGDDNPLIIRSIAAFQVQLYAICYLEGGHQYALYTGDSTANAADYDLSFLNNRAYNLLPSISQFAVRNNPGFSNRLHVVPGDHSIWLWTTLIIVLVILSVLTIKMVKEVK